MRKTYDSLAQAAADAEKRHNGRYSDENADEGPDGFWALGASFSDALELARKGWTDQLETALEVAETAIEMAEKENMVDSFSQPVWDVTGAMVDVGAYLSGTPECMVDYPLSTTSKVGRVITLVASCSFSAAVSADTIQRRGQLVVALAIALTRLGHGVELWVNNHTGHSKSGECEFNVKVKGVDDEIDPAQIMFAYAHPAMLRRLVFGIRESLCSDISHTPKSPTKGNFPEGTIFLPEVKSDRDVPDADSFLREYLGELGLLAE